MAHSHGQPDAPESASGRYMPRLIAALVIAASYMVVEFAVGFATSSLSLISDATHMLTDVLGIALAVGAIVLARRSGPTAQRSFGFYRAEVLAALANAVLLFGVAAYVVVEAINRISDPPEIPGLPVVLAALGGLIANVISFALLRSGARESLNIRGAYLEVLADLIGSFGVLLSGAIIFFTGWRYADLILGVAIGLFVLPRTYVLAKRALRILFQHAPEDVDVTIINAKLRELPGVVDVHDLHVWTLTSGMEVASAHVTIENSAVPTQVLANAQNLLAREYKIDHATIQVERGESSRSCQELSW